MKELDKNMYFRAKPSTFETVVNKIKVVINERIKSPPWGI
jgi:hypothetical protein